MPDTPFQCPRRPDDPHGIFALQAHDTWEPGSTRWQAGDYFPEGFTAPRTCSFCGSAHPEDVLALLAQGWEDEKATGKEYKGYLHPPGHGAAFVAALAATDAGTPMETAFADVPRDPIPPAKFYTPHFAPPQLAELNAFVRSKKKR